MKYSPGLLTREPTPAGMSRLQWATVPGSAVWPATAHCLIWTNLIGCWLLTVNTQNYNYPEHMDRAVRPSSQVWRSRNFTGVSSFFFRSSSVTLQRIYWQSGDNFLLFSFLGIFNCAMYRVALWYDVNIDIRKLVHVNRKCV